MDRAPVRMKQEDIDMVSFEFIMNRNIFGVYSLDDSGTDFCTLYTQCYDCSTDLKILSLKAKHMRFALNPKCELCEKKNSKKNC